MFEVDDPYFDLFPEGIVDIDFPAFSTPGLLESDPDNFWGVDDEAWDWDSGEFWGGFQEVAQVGQEIGSLVNAWSSLWGDAVVDGVSQNPVLAGNSAAVNPNLIPAGWWPFGNTNQGGNNTTLLLLVGAGIIALYALS